MRISLMKSGSDKIVYIVDSIRIDGKVKTKVIKRLGRLSDLEKEHPNALEYCKNEAMRLTEEKKLDEDNFIVKFFPTRELEFDKQVQFNAGYLFLQKIYYGLKLDKVCLEISEKYKFDYDLNKILKDLIFSRIIYPSSKLSTYKLAKIF